MVIYLILLVEFYLPKKHLTKDPNHISFGFWPGIFHADIPGGTGYYVPDKLSLCHPLLQSLHHLAL